MSVSNVFRWFPKTRFKILGLLTIKDIPTTKFNEIIKTLIDDGWEKYYEYKGFDAWIDYGHVKLIKSNIKLNLEWDNWTEGSIEGPAKEIEKLSEAYGFKVSNEWRWSEYDQKP